MSRLPVMPKFCAVSFYVRAHVKTACQPCGLYEKMAAIKDSLQGKHWRARGDTVPTSLWDATLTKDLPGHLVTIHVNHASLDHFDVKNRGWGLMSVHGRWKQNEAGRVVFRDYEMLLAGIGRQQGAVGGYFAETVEPGGRALNGKWEYCLVGNGAREYRGRAGGWGTCCDSRRHGEERDSDPRV